MWENRDKGNKWLVDTEVRENAPLWHGRCPRWADFCRCPCVHSWTTTTISSTGTSTMSQTSIPWTNRTFICQLSSPPASNTLVWDKCLTLACSSCRSRIFYSLIKLSNNYNYSSSIEHVGLWQGVDIRHYLMRRPRWWHRGHRPFHLIAPCDISHSHSISVHYLQRRTRQGVARGSITDATLGVDHSDDTRDIDHVTWEHVALPMHYLYVDGRQSTSLNTWTRECMNE